MTMPAHLRFVATRMTDPVAASLVADVQAEYVQRYGGADVGGNDGDEFAGARGAFFVLWSESGDGETEAVGSGAWRWHDVPPHLAADLTAAGVRMPAVDRVVELKRMFVRAPHRRRGYARHVLAALEVEARLAGAQVVVLETGTEQPEAMALYGSAGYVPVTVFGPYADSPLSRAYAKVL